jgi:hypothetical protein
MHQALLEYIESASDLAESVKRNIMKAKKNVAVIDDETVLKLNRFMKASNGIVDLPEQLNNSVAKLN